MINVLIADDNTDKARRITEVARELFSEKDISIRVAPSVIEANEWLKEEHFDLMLLDLNIPMRAGEPPRVNGGAQLLEQLTRRGPLRLPSHVLGLTAFDELRTLHFEQFRAEGWTLLHYDETSGSWANIVARKLIHVYESKNLVQSAFQTDLCIVTALHAIELESVLDLDANWREFRVSGDDTIYYRGEMRGRNGQLRLVAAAALEMGMPAATALSMKMIYNFRPRILAMCGIAAGVKGDFGDVLIAEHAWDYGSGKIRHSTSSGSIFLPAPSQIPLEPALKAKVNHFLMDQSHIRSIRVRWEGEAPANLKARLGPVASGAAVLENKELIEQIQSHDRKLIGVEMETYGVYHACRASSAPRPHPISIKSICDFGDVHKDDRFQKYAAFTSAQFLCEFAKNEL